MVTMIKSDEEKEFASSMKRIQLTRQSLRVKRCHAIPHNGEYTVGHHTTAMLTLAWEVYRDDFLELAPYILSHDLPECWIGDIPAPPKRYSREINRVFTGLEDVINTELQFPLESALQAEKPELYKKLKDLDWLELYLWCRDQATMGNKNCLAIIDELENFADESPLLPEIRIIANHFNGDIIFDKPECLIKSLKANQ